ncbi:MAG: hypothetical protein HQK55_03410, partial [Deltaproteobacteria bacterium]|nr:hypothetical protein [Deltaproteobacteria bacterium]
MRHIIYFFLFGMVFSIFSLGSPVLGAGLPEPDPGTKVQVASDDLKRLVDLLEDEKKREIFVRDLKNLIRLQEGSTSAVKKTDSVATSAPEAAKVIKPISEGIDAFTESIIDEVSRLAWQIGRAPFVINRLTSFLADQNNWFDLAMLLVDLLGGILAAFCMAILLRRYRPRPPEHYLNPLRRLWFGGCKILIALAPFLILFLAVWGLFNVLPVFSPAKNFFQE